MLKCNSMKMVLWSYIYSKKLQERGVLSSFTVFKFVLFVLTSMVYKISFGFVSINFNNILLLHYFVSSLLSPAELPAVQQQPRLRPQRIKKNRCKSILCPSPDSKLPSHKF